MIRMIFVTRPVDGHNSEYGVANIFMNTLVETHNDPALIRNRDKNTKCTQNTIYSDN